MVLLPYFLLGTKGIATERAKLAKTQAKRRHPDDTRYLKYQNCVFSRDRCSISTRRLLHFTGYPYPLRDCRFCAKKGVTFGG